MKKLSISIVNKKKLCIAVLQKKFVNHNSVYRSRKLKHFTLQLSFAMVQTKVVSCKMCTQRLSQLWCNFAIFQALLHMLIYFGTIAINYVLSTLAVVNACKHLCNDQLFMQLWYILIDSFCMHYCIWQLLYATAECSNLNYKSITLLQNSLRTDRQTDQPTSRPIEHYYIADLYWHYQH